LKVYTAKTKQVSRELNEKSLLVAKTLLFI